MSAFDPVAVVRHCVHDPLMSAQDTIVEVGIDEEGRLYVRPSTLSFDLIYRAGMEVKWDGEKHRLFGSKPRDWTYADWFKQINVATTNEYDTVLCLTTETEWSNVPASVRAEIDAVAQS